MTRSNFLTVLAGVLMTGMCIAEETADSSWSASAELGYLHTSGNSDTRSLKAKLKASMTQEAWTHSANVEALNAAQNDIRSAEKYRVELQSNYAMSAQSYVFGAADWEKDRFSSFDYQASLVAGYGYKVIAEPSQELSLEVAPGYRSSEPVVGDREDEAVAYFAEKYTLDLSETATFEQFLKSEYGDSNTATRFGVALSSQVAGNLSMKLAYELKHNSDVPETADNTDSETSVTLVYTF